MKRDCAARILPGVSATRPTDRRSSRAEDLPRRSGIVPSAPFATVPLMLLAQPSPAGKNNDWSWR